jgi:hypothetical protein
MRKCGISKATYYRAKAKLQELGLFDFQESKVSFRNLTGISTIKEKAQKSEPSLKNETAELEMRPEPQERENKPVKPAPSKVSKTLQTYLDLLKTLSEGMRESFEKFCLKKMQECSFKIGSRTAWLNKYATEYLQEFKETYSYALANPEVIAPKAPFPTPDIPWLKQMYGNGWKDAAIHFGLIDPNSPEEEIQDESEQVASSGETAKLIADSDNPQEPTPPTPAIESNHEQFAKGDRVVVVEVGNTHYGKTGKIIAARFGSKDDKYIIAMDRKSPSVRELTIKIPKGCKLTYLTKL